MGGKATHPHEKNPTVMKNLKAGKTTRVLTYRSTQCNRYNRAHKCKLSQSSWSILRSRKLNVCTIGMTKHHYTGRPHNKEKRLQHVHASLERTLVLRYQPFNPQPHRPIMCYTTNHIWEFPPNSPCSNVRNAYAMLKIRIKV